MGTTPRSPRRHETRALLRAHLAAATRYRHATHNCPVCHRLLRLEAEHSAEAQSGLPHEPSAGTTAVEPSEETAGAPPSGASAADRHGGPPVPRSEPTRGPRRVTASK